MSKKIISRLFNYAIQSGAEHLVVSGQSDRISLDCHLPNGETRTFTLPKKLERDFFSNLQQILAVAPGDLLTREYRKMDAKNGQWKYYLSVLPENKGEKIIISLINQPAKLWRLSQLGLQATDLRKLKKISSERHGLVIVSSPPQNGKSSTLYSLAALLNKTANNIYALSSVLPDKLSDVNQLAPTPDNWRKILQHDSDIILTDSLDEGWALAQALSAAASGRLVLGTMTSDNAFGVLARILEAPLPKRLKLDALKLIISQRLVNLKKTREKRGQAERQSIGLFEILELSPEIKSFIAASDESDLRTAKFAKKLAQLALVSGFRPLAIDERQKIKDGLI